MVVASKMRGSVATAGEGEGLATGTDQRSWAGETISVDAIGLTGH